MQMHFFRLLAKVRRTVPSFLVLQPQVGQATDSPPFVNTLLLDFWGALFGNTYGISSQLVMLLLAHHFDGTTQLR